MYNECLLKLTFKETIFFFCFAENHCVCVYLHKISILNRKVTNCDMIIFYCGRLEINGATVAAAAPTVVAAAPLTFPCARGLRDGYNNVSVFVCKMCC